MIYNNLKAWVNHHFVVRRMLLSTEWIDMVPSESNNNFWICVKSPKDGTIKYDKLKIICLVDITIL
jgi:hypothetical protein